LVYYESVEGLDSTFKVCLNSKKTQNKASKNAVKAINKKRKGAEKQIRKEH
jgi:hypothetical protein